MATIIDIIPKEAEVMENLIYILSHTDGLWPRTISTLNTRGAQILVNSLEEAMKWFKASNFIDCRINAYPKYTDYYINRTGIAPTVLHVDIDREHFETQEEFELTASKTYINFEKILGSRPTVLSTGGGHHYIQPQQVPVLEESDKFSKFDQPSRRFLQFEERLLTDNKCDQNHCSTVSFNNMMLRIPSSLNSKLVQFDDGGRITDIPYDARVRVEKKWDGNTPTVGKILLMEYYNYLQFGAIKDIREQRVRESQYRCYGRARVLQKINLYGYDYIDRLLDKPLDDFRKFCIWKILVPYLINVKRLPRLEAFNRIKSWLDRCNSVSRLNFNPVWRINYAINHVGTFYPIHRDRLGDKNKLFYERLKKEGIIQYAE